MNYKSHLKIIFRVDRKTLKPFFLKETTNIGNEQSYINFIDKDKYFVSVLPINQLFSESKRTNIDYFNCYRDELKDRQDREITLL